MKSNFSSGRFGEIHNIMHALAKMSDKVRNPAFKTEVAPRPEVIEFDSLRLVYQPIG